MKALKPYHISAAIFIAGAICLIIFMEAWLIGIIGLVIGYEIIEHGLKLENKECSCNEKKCCQGNSEEHHKSTTVGNDEQRKGEDN